MPARRSTRRSLPVLVGAGGLLLALPALAMNALGAEPVVVQPGDTVSELALQHGVEPETIVALNGLVDPNRIIVGQVLKLTPSVATVPTATGAAGVHVVAAGENLTGIARRHGTTVAALATANSLANPSLIFAGQQLVIPGTPPAGPMAAAPAAAPPPSAAQPQSVATTHLVTRGENLTGIARRYEVSVADIAAANAIANPSLIFAGLQLVIPDAGAAVPSVPESMAARVAERDGVRALVVEEAVRLGVPPAFALAVAWQESGWRQEVVSSAGAVGIMQLMPATAEWVGATLLAEPVAIGDPRWNVRAGVSLLSHYLARYGSRDLALAAYYQGPTALDTHGIYPVTRQYIAAIGALEDIFFD